MKIKNILFLGVALLVATPTFSATDDNDGTTQTLTVNEETVDLTVSEIRMDGNNAVLTFIDGTTLTADMRLVSITMSYDEATGLTPKPLSEMEGSSYYTLGGIKVSVKPKQKGLFIHNGKKVVSNK